MYATPMDAIPDTSRAPQVAGPDVPRGANYDDVMDLLSQASTEEGVLVSKVRELAKIMGAERRRGKEAYLAFRRGLSIHIRATCSARGRDYKEVLADSLWWVLTEMDMRGRTERRFLKVGSFLVNFGKSGEEALHRVPYAPIWKVAAYLEQATSVTPSDLVAYCAQGAEHSPSTPPNAKNAEARKKLARKTKQNNVNMLHAKMVRGNKKGGVAPAEGGAALADGGAAPAYGGATPANGGAMRAVGRAERAVGRAGRAEGGAERAEGGAERAEGGAERAEGGAERAEGGAERAEGGAQRAEGGAERAEGGAQRAEGGGQRAEGGAQRAEGGAQRAEGGAQRAEGGAQRTESSAQRAEGGAQRAEGGAPPAQGGGQEGQRWVPGVYKDCPDDFLTKKLGEHIVELSVEADFEEWKVAKITHKAYNIRQVVVSVSLIRDLLIPSTCRSSA
ncbi:hypothetical protein CYMTET_45285 [Cymbomonas tetramitiformis]|uniref:Uncharacterized protein n=1 Tax=Cymbomonas tetramitiformis TaxID=36881 RepID=A0AAE0C0C1_9CHLO|nr:hypothetical protein CYMTET_45285 [Cymbomonas tetramitiformis]